MRTASAARRGTNTRRTTLAVALVYRALGDATSARSTLRTARTHDCQTVSRSGHPGYTYWGSTFLPLSETRTNGTDSVCATTDIHLRLLGSGPLRRRIRRSVAKYSRYDVMGRKTWEVSSERGGELGREEVHVRQCGSTRSLASIAGLSPDPSEHCPSGLRVRRSMRTMWKAPADEGGVRRRGRMDASSVQQLSYDADCAPGLFGSSG